MNDLISGSRHPDRIERALDGLLTESELAALKADVVRDPTLRSAYVDRAWLDAALRAERDHLPRLLASPATPAVPAAPASHAARPVRWPIFAAIAGTLAASFVIAFAVSRWLPAIRPADAPIATLTSAANTTWAGSTLPTAEDSALGHGTLALVQGIATLRFASGAMLTLEAPTKLELVNAMHARLIEGSLTAEVPAAAHGFTVETADLKVVDLGTRFGVTASSTGHSHVFVFEGEVQLEHPSGDTLRRLTAGKAFHVSSGAVAAGNVEPARPPTLERIDGWTSIPTSFGRGKDAYARRSAANEHPQPLLLVKHSDLPLSFRNERRASLAFDLANVDARSIAEAELVLDPEPSGLGFSALAHDARFAVYGAIDEALDAWNETALTWETTPGAGSDATFGGQLRKLAEFSLPRGASGDPLTVRSPELAAFLRADTNGLATFLIVRETGETDPSGLVHAFASKEHPTARPPTLRIR